MTCLALSIVVDRIMHYTQKGIHILTLRTSEYVALHGIRDIVDVIKLISSNEEFILGYPGGHNEITSLYKRDTKGSKLEKKKRR